MKIVISAIQTPFIQGGAEYLIKNLKTALINLGHEVELVTLPFKFFPESYINYLIDICCNLDYSDFSGYQPELMIALQFPAYYIKHPNKILWIMHQHRTVYDLYEMQNKTPQLKALRKKIFDLDKKILPLAKKIYSNSRNVSKRLKKFNNIDSQPLYHPPPNAHLYYTADIWPYIFYPSRLEILKRQDLLIKAFKFVKSPVKAIIAGKGGQEKYYRKLINDLNLEQKVALIGHISEEEKISLYAHSLAVFFGPYDEDYGYVTLEAMLASKPVITCKDSGGPLEFVIDGETGFIVDPHPEIIAEKIDWLYYNIRKAKNMGKEGKEVYYRLIPTWKEVATKLITSK